MQDKHNHLSQFAQSDAMCQGGIFAQHTTNALTKSLSDATLILLTVEYPQTANECVHDIANKT